MKLAYTSKAFLLLFAFISGSGAALEMQEKPLDEHFVEAESFKFTHKEESPAMDSTTFTSKTERGIPIKLEEKGGIENMVATTSLDEGSNAPPGERLGVGHQRRELFLETFFDAIFDVILFILNLFDIFNIIPDPPTPPPTGPPIEPNQEGCNLATSFLLFEGHDQVYSYMQSEVEIIWSPAFVADISGNFQSFLWCGKYTYFVFINRGKFDFTTVNRTVAELIALANEVPTMDVIETQKTALKLNGFVAGQEYSVLVTATTSVGHASFNRVAATVIMSEKSPVMLPGYTRTVILEEPPFTDDNPEWSAVFNKEATTVTFSGGYPDEINDIKKDDFVYVYASDGSASLIRPKTKLTVDGDSTLVWEYNPSGLEEIFEDLDASLEINQNKNSFNNIGETFDPPGVEALSDDEIDIELESLAINVKLSICKALDGVDDLSCFDDENDPDKRMLRHGTERKLLRRERRQNIFKALKAAVAFVAKVVEVVDNAIAIVTTTPPVTLTFLDINKAASLKCTTTSSGGAVSREASFEIGVQFDLSARASVRIRIGLTAALPLRAGSIRLFGGFGGSVFANLAATASAEFKPTPIQLFRVSNTFNFQIGPVPIIVTNRPSINAFIEASASVEGEAVLTVGFGYDYDIFFEFDILRLLQPFTLEVDFKRRDPFEEEPSFNLRLKAEARMGVTLGWDILLFGLLQGTLAADLGIGAAIGVGTDVEALVVTNPFFYVLDAFDISLFLRIRASVGLNSDITKIVQKLEDASTPSQCVFQIGDFVVPTANSTGATTTPENLQEAVDEARTDDKFVDETAITIDQLKEDGILVDTFKDTIQKVLDQGLAGIGFEFTVFEDDLLLLGIPRYEEDDSSSSNTCVGDDAIVLTVVVDIKKALIPFKNDVKDALWFANFDGKIFRETTQWTLDGDITDAGTVTMRLPRSAKNQDYQIDDGASLILRATPELVPFPPKSQFAKFELASVFPDVTPFQCCVDSDCQGRTALGIVLAPGEVLFCTAGKLCNKRLA